MRSLCLIALVAASAVLAACGGGDKTAAAPGSPEAPLRAQATPVASPDATRLNEAGTPAATTKPGYSKLLEKQSSKPKQRFSPCNLVSKAKARAIVGRPISDVVEAPQGPTCLYRGKDAGADFVTLSVQAQPIAALKRQMRQRHAVTVGHRTGYCGTFGKPMLYVPVAGGQVLAIAAPCAVARRFATAAIPQLDR